MNISFHQHPAFNQDSNFVRLFCIRATHSCRKFPDEEYNTGHKEHSPVYRRFASLHLQVHDFFIDHSSSWVFVAGRTHSALQILTAGPRDPSAHMFALDGSPGLFSICSPEFFLNRISKLRDCTTTSPTTATLSRDEHSVIFGHRRRSRPPRCEFRGRH